MKCRLLIAILLVLGLLTVPIAGYLIIRDPLFGRGSGHKDIAQSKKRNVVVTRGLLF